MDVNTLSEHISRLSELKERKKELADVVKENNAAIEDAEKQIVSAMLDLAEAAGLDDPASFTVDVNGRRYGVKVNHVTDYTSICVGGDGMAHAGIGYGLSPTLTTKYNTVCVPADKPPRKYIVRRLTPLECLRLQGYPDWWFDGVAGSDTAKYKACGNSLAIPCSTDVLRKIAKEVKACVPK